MINKNIRIVFFGNSIFSLIVLERLKKLGVMPDLVVTTPDKPQGRKMALTPTPTKIWAENNSVEYIEPTNLKDRLLLDKLSTPNLFIVASYGKILPKSLIDIPKYKVLNIHPSLLPKYRGPSPLQEQILNDEKEIGVSIMLIDEQVDHGAIVAKKKAVIADWPVGFHKLQETLAEEGAKLLFEILPDWINGKVKAKEQNHNEATFTKKVEKTDGLIDLSADSFKNYLKTLAYEEWPGTYFEVEKKDVKMRVLIKKASFKNNELVIERVLPEGKKEMDYKSFLNGLK